MRRLLPFLLVLIFAHPAAAQNLVSGLSQDAIQITSSYNGAEIVVFGAIEQPGKDKQHDIVVAVRGPATDMRVLEKSRVAGIWINSDRVILHGMPAYYFIASSRDLAAMAPPSVLRRFGLGMAMLAPNSVTGVSDPEPFRQALIRTESKKGLYRQSDELVRFLSGTLFRVRVPVPAAAPRGVYRVEVYLLKHGEIIGEQSTPLTIDQTGIERRLYDFARLQPLAYGLSTVLMAVLLGWLSSIVFRRME